jgi:hypothetical protein
MSELTALILGLQDPLTPPEVRHRLFAQVVTRFQDMAYGYAWIRVLRLYDGALKG